ncbi:MAG: tRNA pseudouridine(38-40) synthase TruA, partial [Pyrinomonadaceae bacterium]|nr:tRNA pseudouridine(38-40) synthase TruA [Pyrinomonadaceae bacterium]
MSIWKLTIEYEGTRYNGWQKQSVSQMNTRTVQGDLTRAAEKYFGTRVEIGGSGRTDSGVHAIAQVAHLKVRDVDKPYGIKQIQFGLNDNLPADINVS